jgi:hypothetical protein
MRDCTSTFGPLSFLVSGSGGVQKLVEGYERRFPGKSGRIGFANQTIPPGIEETAMPYRKARPSSHQSNLRLIGKHDQQGRAACFAGQRQVLSPLLSLVEDAKASIDESMSDAARTFIEQLLILSAVEVAGSKHLGRRASPVRCTAASADASRSPNANSRLNAHGFEARKARSPYPRMRICAMTGGSGRRLRDNLVTGVSTRKYARVLPVMAGTVGIKKSSVARQFV